LASRIIVDLTADADEESAQAGPPIAGGSVSGPSNAGSSSAAPIPAADNIGLCVICALNRATCAASCGHIVSCLECKGDAEKWLKQKKECPLARCKVKPALIRLLGL